MNRIIIVTGASRGIGRDIAKKLAQNGEKVIANYNNSEKEALELKKELADENIDIDIYKADVSKKEEVIGLVNYAINKYKKIDVLINNAGISNIKLFTEVTDGEWNNMINTNLYSAFCCSQEVAKNMIQNKSGLIINISSIWGLVGASCETLYSITKAGMDAMTKSLAKELGLSNIRVNSIAPGIIDTDINKCLSNKDMESIKEEIPLNKIGNARDITKCVEWLIEDEYTTGQIISVNGGWVII